MLKKLVVDGARCSFDIVSDNMGMANGVRRALMADVTNIAPKHVVFRKNTSCQTDEYIAHRIGLIPFIGDTNGKARLCVSGRQAMASDFVSDDVRIPFDVPIIKLAKGQSLEIDVEFETGTGAHHARFSQIGAVGYAVDEAARTTSLTFHSINGETPLTHLERAIESLLKRIDDTIYFVETEYDSVVTLVNDQ